MISHGDLYVDVEAGQTIAITEIDGDEVVALVMEVQEGLDRDAIERRVATGELSSFAEIHQQIDELARTATRVHEFGALSTGETP